MDLRRLRYFIAVAEELNFTKAAARLQMAQPPLSRQIKQLERELGAQLFVRTKRSVRLTDAGEALLRVGEELLAEAERARASVQRAARGESGRLLVGYAHNVADDVLPRALGHFRQRAADADVELVELPARDQIDALLADRLQVGLLNHVSADDQIRFELLRHEQIFAVLPEHHPLAQRDTVSVAELMKEHLILGPGQLSAPYALSVLEECSALNVHPPAGVQTTDRQSVVVLVASGAGVSIALGPPARFYQRGVVLRPLVGRAPLTGVTVAAWRRDTTSLLVGRFVDALRWAASPDTD